MGHSVINLLAVLTLVASPSQSAPVAPPDRADAATVQAPVIAGSAVEGCRSPAPAAQDGTMAQKSCCSGAGGFCGCTGGKARCCNGDIAPSCACRADTSAAATVESEK
jgi:hypothetical protein